ncbi:hypothetical protein [uncultured Bacteroides sp.]|uniref:hypothetical protein n=1 Tax=uncultured Bacteroides sp. TaxID=162156 RepID=UPI0026262A57|nr:hypothetical protein [uncultured Bacteroides sp.]
MAKKKSILQNRLSAPAELPQNSFETTSKQLQNNFKAASKLFENCFKAAAKHVGRIIIFLISEVALN